MQKSTDEDEEVVLQVFKILTMMSNLAINPGHMTRISMSKLQVALALSQEFRKTLVILLRKELRGLMGGLRTEPKGYAIKKKTQLQEASSNLAVQMADSNKTPNDYHDTEAYR